MAEEEIFFCACCGRQFKNGDLEVQAGRCYNCRYRLVPKKCDDSGNCDESRQSSKENVSEDDCL